MSKHLANLAASLITQQEGSTSFLKKRSKKRLTVWARSTRKSRSQTSKNFWFFFSKKNMLSVFA
jgi:hypothetical protein